MKEHSTHAFEWKPLKWWLLGFIALILSLWLSGPSFMAQAEPITSSRETTAEQAVFKIGGDLVVTESQTVEDAFAIGGDVTVEEGAVIQGDTFAIGGDVRLADNARVNGDAFTIGGRIIRAESAVVNGSEFAVLETFSSVFDRFGVFGTLYLGNLVFWIVMFVGAAIAGLLLLLLLHDNVSAIATTLQSRPFGSLLYGIGGIAAIGLLTVLTAGSALGAVLIPIANLAVLLTSLFGGTAACIWLGKRLRRFELEASFRQFWTGLIILFVISLVPFLGGALIGLVVLFGFGATLLAKYGKQPKALSPQPLDRLEQLPE